MQQTKTDIRRMIAQAIAGGYLSTLAYYVYIEVPPSLRIDGIKGGPYHSPKSLVPVVPLLGDFSPAAQYDPCILEEMETLSDALLFLAKWKWEGHGIIFHKALTSLSKLEDTHTRYYNALKDTCDHVCPGCGSISEVLIFNLNENKYYARGFPCANCPLSPYPKSYIQDPEKHLANSDRSLVDYDRINSVFLP